MDAPHQFNKRGAIADLETHVQAELPLGALANIDHLQCSGHVHGHRLFEINVLAGGNDSFEMVRMKIGWRGNYHRVQFLGRRDLLVSVGPNKELRCAQRRIAFRLLNLVEVRPRLVELVLKHVSQGDDASATGVNEVRRVLGAAPAAAEQANADRGVGGRAAHQLRLDQQDAGSGRSGPDEFSAVEFV